MTSSELGRDLLAQLRMDLASSIFLPQQNAAGEAYLQILDLSQSPVPLAGRLPVIDQTGIFRKESSGGTFTGNRLCFAEVVRTDNYECISTRRYRVPVYRFHYYYLTPIGAGPQPDHPWGLDLCHWVSEDLADASRIEGITDDTDRREVLRHLRSGSPDHVGERHPPIVVAWRVGAPADVTRTWLAITDQDTVQEQPPPGRSNGWRILRNPRLSRIRFLEESHLSVATNFAAARFGVARFADVSSAGAGFPHGFEVQIVGTAGARKVLVALALVEQRKAEALAFFRQHTVASVPQGVTL
jgi:hypothetical protein